MNDESLTDLNEKMEENKWKNDKDFVKKWKKISFTASPVFQVLCNFVQFFKTAKPKFFGAFFHWMFTMDHSATINHGFAACYSDESVIIQISATREKSVPNHATSWQYMS